MASEVMARDELVRELREGGAEALATLRALPEAAFEEGRYENGWNGRQILAHLAAIEWTYPRLLEIPSATAQSDESEGAGSAPRGGMDGYNARQVEKRAGATVAELIEEFERNRTATIAAVEGADEGLFATPIVSAGGRNGSLGRVFYEVAVLHVREHVGDIAGR
jgi:hypothetical protein